MFDVGYGRRMVFGSEERREHMRKREEKRNNERGERNFGELKRRENVLKNYYRTYIPFSYSTIVNV